jgi:hypothetical protein
MLTSQKVNECKCWMSLCLLKAKGEPIWGALRCPLGNVNVYNISAACKPPRKSNLIPLLLHEQHEPLTNKHHGKYH